VTMTIALIRDRGTNNAKVNEHHRLWLFICEHALPGFLFSFEMNRS